MDRVSASVLLGSNGFCVAALLQTVKHSEASGHLCFFCTAYQYFCCGNLGPQHRRPANFKASSETRGYLVVHNPLGLEHHHSTFLSDAVWMEMVLCHSTFGRYSRPVCLSGLEIVKRYQ